MSTMASQITSLTILYSAVYSRCRSKKTSKLRVTGLCEGKSPVTGEFPAQRASNAENVSIWWRHHAAVTKSQKWESFRNRRKPNSATHHLMRQAEATLLRLHIFFRLLISLTHTNVLNMHCYCLKRSHFSHSTSILPCLVIQYWSFSIGEAAPHHVL